MKGSSWSNVTPRSRTENVKVKLYDLLGKGLQVKLGEPLACATSNKLT